MELNRITANLERLQEIYPESAWIWDAANRLEDIKQRLSLPREGGGHGQPWIFNWMEIAGHENSEIGEEEVQ